MNEAYCSDYLLVTTFVIVIADSQKHTIPQKFGNMAEPSPIKVVRKPQLTRQPNWKKEERVKLLDHILMYMEDPTRGYNRLGKRDIELNVLPKVSPDIEESPEESRKLDEIITQYYRCVCMHANTMETFITKIYISLGRGTPQTTRKEYTTGSRKFSSSM